MSSTSSSATRIGLSIGILLNYQSDSEAWASTDDDSLPETSVFAEFQRLLDEASTKLGRKMNIAPHHKQALVHAGFQDVVDEFRKVSVAVLYMILRGTC